MLLKAREQGRKWKDKPMEEKGREMEKKISASDSRGIPNVFKSTFLLVRLCISPMERLKAFSSHMVVHSSEDSRTFRTLITGVSMDGETGYCSPQSLYR